MSADEVEVGQVWEDKDRRMQGRYVRVDAVVGEYAFCYDIAGRSVRLLTRRMGRGSGSRGWRLLPPVAGGSCHPSHWEGPPLPGKTDEEVTRAWEQFKKEDRIDPRAIRRQHRFKPGHEPDFLEPSSGWKYMKIELESDADPDQLDMLHGGPAVNMNCERCGTQLHAVGEMTQWDIMTQALVSIANLEDITEERKKVLQEEIIVILACPDCKSKYQWLKEFLPRD